ncbi:hypothetical protein MMC26_002067 [Xylographa opegraphella]|nr:hypothetical protein [Xylographa opegraphella]
MLAAVSSSVGLSSRSFYLKYSVEQFQARPSSESTGAWASGTLLTEVAAQVFGDETRYLLGLQGYLALTAWAVYMNTEGGRRRIPHLWLFLLLTPVVSFALAQTLFYIAVLLSDPKEDTEVDVVEVKSRGRAMSPSMTILALSGAYLSAFVLPYAYGTSAFLWVFLIAYAMPLVLTYIPHRHDAVEAQWRLVAITSFVLYSYQLGIALFSHTVAKGQWSSSDLVSALYDLQWAWTAHPVTRALGYDLSLSAVTLVYWSYIQTREALSTVVAADSTKCSSHNRKDHMRNEQSLPAYSGYRSAEFVALTVVVAGLGAGSASVYRA